MRSTIEHFGRIIEPNYLQRCLEQLEGLPRLDDEDALDAWLERTEDDGSDLAEPARRLLLTEFLDCGYEDAPDRGPAAVASVKGEGAGAP